MICAVGDCEVDEDKRHTSPISSTVELRTDSNSEADISTSQPVALRLLLYSVVAGVPGAVATKDGEQSRDGPHLSA